ncbi:MAG: ABC-F family ATP-binding cassette domain-containing protein [Actinomycetaceae bacterium]|nr:ABC-F family ATP-binding cassette domain-containing protein [Actinomycetaceae bacterium]
MLSVCDLKISIGQRQLLAGASFTVNKGDRIGFVGRNGAGKTTTMKLLASQNQGMEAVAVEGTINVGGTIGYLAQDPAVGDPEIDGISRIIGARGLDELVTKIAKASREMAGSGARAEKAMNRYVRLDHEFTMQGGYAARSEAAQIADGLGLTKRELSAPLQTLSGGQRRRVELARVLFSNADTLLLDEPTNHLDHDSVLWLRNYLNNYSGGFMVISHSVALLDEVVNKVFYLDANRASLDAYNLGWKAYLKKRDEDEKRRHKENLIALKKAEQLRAQGEKMRAKATKAVAARQMLRRAQELMDTVGQAQEEKVAHIEFPQPLPCGKVPLQGIDLAKTYGSLEVFLGVNLAIDRGAKVVILGQNGAGKTTLLRLLAGLEEPDLGEVRPGHGLKLGYYAQEHETLDIHASVLENMVAVSPGMEDAKIRGILGQFLFSGDDVYKPAAVLSGGEKTRLALATLVVSGANVLLLDEPTNNLDPASREEILQAIRNYAGAVVLVTHDTGAVCALDPERVILLPEGDEDLWDESYLDLVTMT